MTEIGTESAPLFIAIIGSGPSGFYAAEYYLKQTEKIIYVDMFDRLPTPFGLVRGGVAPDHDKIKSVTKVYDKIATNPRFRFFGHVELGKDITHADLTANYHQIIYATGAQTDRRLGIAGEDLQGSHAATEFVGWYNAHPDYRDLTFDLSQERVAIVGNGNVAMDVARILASSVEELEKTDIADYALTALRESKVKEIYVLGRRSPAQAAFTNPEIKELGNMSISDIIVPVEDATLDPLSAAALEAATTSAEQGAKRNVAILQKYAEQEPTGKPRRIIMRFLVSPVELIGADHVEAIKLVKNELVQAEDGSLRPRATETVEVIPVGLVFRSIGYKGVQLPDVPFDAKNGVIPNQQGRVINLETGLPLTGEYVVGWIKRGPSGVIGTNRPDSVETVTQALQDALEGNTLQPSNPNRDAIVSLLTARKVEFVTYADWLQLDAIEQARGAELNRPRLKFSCIDEMLSAIRNAAPSAIAAD